MPKKKDGTIITWKQFFKLWVEGIKNLTPEQKISNESRGTLVTLIGFALSLVVLIIFKDKLIVSWFAYGLILVFIGNIWTTGIKWLTLRQQLKLMKGIDQQSINIKDIMGKIDMEGRPEVKENVKE